MAREFKTEWLRQHLADEFVHSSMCRCGRVHCCGCHDCHDGTPRLLRRIKVAREEEGNKPFEELIFEFENHIYAARVWLRDEEPETVDAVEMREVTVRTVTWIPFDAPFEKAEPR